MNTKLQTAKEIAACWCGRGKDGKCDGSHTFTEEEWAEQNYEWSAEKFDKTPQEAFLAQPTTEMLEMPMGWAACGCGRSPNGYCIGWHALSSEELEQAKLDWEKQNASKSSS